MPDPSRGTTWMAPEREEPASRLYIVTIGFGAAVAMWAIGYVGRVPPAVIPAPLILVLLVACLVAGGGVAAVRAGAGLRGGAMVGGVAGVLNLLVLGSVLATGGEPNAVVPSALVWVPGSILASAALGALGVLGVSIRGAGDAPRVVQPALWRSGFGFVAAAATLLVVIAGGLVTSLDAGMAVPDWPSSFGSNMFLYPLARMTGGVYYEHAHRLYGSLVGLTTIVLAVVVWRTDRRRWLWGLAVLLVGMVVAQGVMGGYRVTLTSRHLAAAHGIFGQVFFATVVLAWTFLTRAWVDAGRVAAGPASAGGAATDRALTTVLLTLVILQVVVGATYRHFATPDEPLPWSAFAHFTLAALIVVLGAVAGLRAWAFRAETPVLRRLGGGLVLVIGAQLVLGVAALVPVMAHRAEWKAAEVILATAHQANGAILLAVTAALMAWTRRSRAGSLET